jgi:hypothetical protein
MFEGPSDRGRLGRVAVALAFALLGAQACKAPLRGAAARPRSARDIAASIVVLAPPLERAERALEEGLVAMDRAYDDGRPGRVKLYFEVAIKRFETARNLYLESLLDVDEPQQEVIEEQLAKVKKYVTRCYRDRPVAD